LGGNWHSIARTVATDTINGLCVSPDGRLFATASWDGAVRVLDFDEGRIGQTLRGHEGRVYAVAIHPNGRSLASAGTDAVVRVWDRETGQALWEPGVSGADRDALAERWKANERAEQPEAESPTPTDLSDKQGIDAGGLLGRLFGRRRAR
jgi:WD40 repeat protein